MKSATSSKRQHVVVVGAGAFGGWTALHLRRLGVKVTLLDAWGPGHARASSGGETRIIRGTYGPCPPYYKLVARSLHWWKEYQRIWQKPLYRKTGLIWLAGMEDSYERASMKLLRAAGLNFEKIPVSDAAKRYPQISFEGVKYVIREEDAGYLLARRACAAVVEALVHNRGEYQQLQVKPGRIRQGMMEPIRLSDGTVLKADDYVFACGPWLGKLFPGVVEIRSTRQEVYYFGTPPGDDTYQEEKLPAWIDHGTKLFYGIPGNEWRGFKVADDTSGDLVDPEKQDRVPRPELIAKVRSYLKRRFPKLAKAPLVGAEVCQYERTSDNHYLVDRHPEASNVWLVGGGSGHGYKNGPALGEYVAELVLGRCDHEPFFGLARLNHG